jgi:hypothetical protein
MIQHKCYENVKNIVKLFTDRKIKEVIAFLSKYDTMKKRYTGYAYLLHNYNKLMFLQKE